MPHVEHWYTHEISANHGPGSESQQGLAKAAVAAHSTATLGTTVQTPPAALVQAHGVALPLVQFGGDLAKYVYPLGRERLPQKLIHSKIWLVWKSVPKPDPSKKPDKMPHYVSGVLRNGPLDMVCPPEGGRH